MDVDAIAIRGEWIRHAPHRSALLGRPLEPSDGRWQRGDIVRALYVADEPDTAVAGYRFGSRARPRPGRRTWPQFQAVGEGRIVGLEYWEASRKLLETLPAPPRHDAAIERQPAERNALRAEQTPAMCDRRMPTSREGSSVLRPVPRPHPGTLLRR